jgi:hypothetical protein
MSTVTEIDLAIQQVDSLLSQLQVNSKARPSAQEPKSVPSKGASRPRASFEVDYCAGRLQLCALQTPKVQGRKLLVQQVHSQRTLALLLAQHLARNLQSTNFSPRHNCRCATDLQPAACK